RPLLGRRASCVRKVRPAGTVTWQDRPLGHLAVSTAVTLACRIGPGCRIPSLTRGCDYGCVRSDRTVPDAVVASKVVSARRASVAATLRSWISRYCVRDLARSLFQHRNSGFMKDSEEMFAIDFDPLAGCNIKV